MEIIKIRANVLEIVIDCVEKLEMRESLIFHELTYIIKPGEKKIVRVESGDEVFPYTLRERKVTVYKFRLGVIE
jgi:hypothetical protein